jgi:chromosome segregation ATPase
LLKLDEQKNNEIHKLQKDLKEKVEKAKNADMIPQKDEEIRLLKIKLEEAIHNNQELKEQLNIFSGASMMMDGLISEKLGLELELEKERKEKEGLKAEIDTTEQLLQEYEDAQKISQDIIKDKENQIIEVNNSMNKLKSTIEEFNKKEENLIKSYNQIKNENNILREEVRTSSNQSVNVDQILNKNVSYT